MSRKDTFIQFFKAQFYNRVRDSRFMIWIIIMPIILMCLLNFIGGDEGFNVDIVVVDEDNTDMSNTALGLLKSQNKFDVTKINSLQEGVDKIKDGKADAMLVIPSDFSEKWKNISKGNNTNYDSIRLKVYYSDNKEIEDTIEYTLKGITSDINDWIVDDDKKPVKISSRTIETGAGSYTNLLVPGGLVIILLQIAVFSSSNSYARLKESMILKRIKSGYYSPIWSLQGMIFLDSILATFGSLIGLTTGIIIYDLNLSLTNFCLLSLLIFLSALIFSYIAQILGRFSSNTISAQAFSSMVLFPLAFFSEAYMFHYLFPEYIKEVSKYLPVGPIVEGLKNLLFMDISTADAAMIIIKSILWLGLFFLIFVLLERD